MLEIEQKFAVPDFAAVERTLADWSARPGADHVESDHYFNAPDRDFARTDEAFRLRRVGSSNCLTYKGPKRAGPVKVRTELEVPLTDGDRAAEEMMRLLVHLGYRPVAVVRKRRRHFHIKKQGFDLTICLDEVDEIGRFVEVEVLAPDEQEATARDVLEATAQALDLTALERRSYLGLLLQARGVESSETAESPGTAVPGLS